MSRDPLAEATRALRAEADASPARRDETRARVLASLQKASHERARRIPLLRVVIPLAAVLVGSMAWAASGGHVPASLGAVFGGSVTSPEAPSQQGVLPSSAPATAPSAAPEPAEAPLDPPAISPKISPIAPDPPSAEEPRSAKVINPPPVAPRPSVARDEASTLTAPAPAAPAAPVAVVAAPAAPALPTEPDEQALYTAAHRLHFVERNPGAALAAWDTYLRAAPRGRLSTEAHYNRALCLVRLGRAAEAEASLQSFARGAYGGYRQAEARALLEALHGTTP